MIDGSWHGSNDGKVVVFATGAGNVVFVGGIIGGSVEFVGGSVEFVIGFRFSTSIFRLDAEVEYQLFFAIKFHYVSHSISHVTERQTCVST